MQSSRMRCEGFHKWRYPNSWMVYNGKMYDLGVTPGNLHVSECIWWVVSDHVFLPKLELLVVGLVGRVLLATKRHRWHGWLCHFMVSCMGLPEFSQKCMSTSSCISWLSEPKPFHQIFPTLLLLEVRRSCFLRRIEWNKSVDTKLGLIPPHVTVLLFPSFQAGDESAALNIPRQSKAGDVAIPWFQRGWNRI